MRSPRAFDSGSSADDSATPKKRASGRNLMGPERRRHAASVKTPTSALVGRSARTMYSSIMSTLSPLQKLDEEHHLHPFTNHEELHSVGTHIIAEGSGVWLRD